MHEVAGPFPGAQRSDPLALFFVDGNRSRKKRQGTSRDGSQLGLLFAGLGNL